MESIQVHQTNSHDEEDERENIPPLFGRKIRAIGGRTFVSVPWFEPTNSTFPLDLRAECHVARENRITGTANARIAKATNRVHQRPPQYGTFFQRLEMTYQTRGGETRELFGLSVGHVMYYFVDVNQTSLAEQETEVTQGHENEQVCVPHNSALAERRHRATGRKRVDAKFSSKGNDSARWENYRNIP